MARHEGIDFRGKNVVLVGRMKTMSSTVMRQHISRLGGINRNTPRSTTHVFVVSDAGGTKVQRVVTRFGGTKTILTEAEFAEVVVALEAPTEDPVPLGDALGELRSAFDGTPTRGSWEAVAAAIDACEEEQRKEAVRYVESHTSRWPNPWDAEGAPVVSYDAVALSLSSRDDQIEGELCVPSIDWSLRMVGGVRAPEFRLVRAVRFQSGKVNGTMASKVVSHPDLVNLRSLDLGTRNKLSKTFYGKLRTSPVMANLEALWLRALDPARASELCGEHALTSLKHVLVMNSEIELEGSPWATLFEAGWWGQIEGLVMDNLNGHYRRSALANELFGRELVSHIGSLERLKHLRVYAPGVVDLLGSDALCDRIERLSLHARTRRNVRALSTRLARPHNLRVLDLSGEWLAYQRGRSEDEPVAIFEHLCEADLLRGLTELRLRARGMTGSQRIAFKHAGEDASVQITWVKEASA